MAGTRSSSRLSGQNGNNNNSSPQSEKSASGTKRKADDATPSGKAKRGRPAKDQKTLEETIDAPVPAVAAEDGKTEGKDDDVEMEQAKETNGDAKHNETAETAAAADNGDAGNKNGEPTGGNEIDKAETGNEDESALDDEKAKENNNENANENDNEKAKGNDDEKAKEKDNEKSKEKDNEKTDGDEKSALDDVKADAGEAGATTKEDDTKESEAPSAPADAIETDKKREQAMPSNILEKGIIYFFTRGRVGVEDPDSVQDLARSYFVLRPLPDGAKITDGAVQDVGNNRLIALPKKVWPKSGKDRFMCFVEKAKTSMDTLKEEFFQGSEYSTKTVGTRQTPEVTPLGEGVYAITSTGGGQGTSHLAYILTIPSELGEVQKDVGLAAKGSFALSVKNPDSSGSGNAQLPNAAEYPKEIIEEFRGRGWMPAHPKHIDYTNASMLLIGEDFDSSSNLDPTTKDEKDDTKATPQEELEKLQDEDESRVENLKGDDTIFEDLGISSKEYPKVMTTW